MHRRLSHSGLAPLVCLWLLLLTGCGLNPWLDRPQEKISPTINEAVLEDQQPNVAPGKTIQITPIITHNYGDLVIVFFYRIGAQTSDGYFIARVRKYGNGWYVGCCTSQGVGVYDMPGLHGLAMLDLAGRSVPIVGRVLSAEVARVEVTMMDGRVISPPIVDRWFLVTDLDNVDACELRLFRADGSVLRRTDVNDNLADMPDLTAPSTCGLAPTQQVPTGVSESSP